MPSIEIACVGLQDALQPPATSFAVAYERGLRSHRSPSPRFQHDFDGLTGCLYHLGNPNLAGSHEGFYFAYDLLSDASRSADPPAFLEFDGNYVESLRAFLDWLLLTSPDGKLLFTSDWQFGPDWTKRCDPITLGEFWRLHDSRALLLNASYPINAG
jgi:hypothetical protein